MNSTCPQCNTNPTNEADQLSGAPELYTKPADALVTCLPPMCSTCRAVFESRLQTLWEHEMPLTDRYKANRLQKVLTAFRRVRGTFLLGQNIGNGYEKAIQSHEGYEIR